MAESVTLPLGKDKPLRRRIEATDFSPADTRAQASWPACRLTSGSRDRVRSLEHRYALRSSRRTRDHALVRLPESRIVFRRYCWSFHHVPMPQRAARCRDGNGGRSPGDAQRNARRWSERGRRRRHGQASSRSDFRTIRSSLSAGRPCKHQGLPPGDYYVDFMDSNHYRGKRSGPGSPGSGYHYQADNFDLFQSAPFTVAVNQTVDLGDVVVDIWPDVVR